MPLRDRQKQFTEVGRIRAGQRIPGRDGKLVPEKLPTYRFTSPAEHLIAEVARQFGGDPRPWDNQFEVITGVSDIPVFLPRQQIDPWYEMWANGVQVRRCDGVTEIKRGKPCLCGPDPERRGCKPTTRAQVMLADVPGIGVWRIDSHSLRAAVAGLGGQIADVVAAIPDGQYLPARLALVPRKEKHLVIENGRERVKTFEFQVPTLYVDGVTARQIQGGGESMLAAVRAAGQRQLPGAAPAAIEAGDDEPATLTPADVIALAPRIQRIPDLQRLWRQAHQDNALTPEVEQALKARATTLGDTAPAAPATADGGPVVDPELEPDTGDLWMRIQQFAGERGWTADDLERRINTAFGKASDEITGWDMRRFLDDMEQELVP